MEYPEIDWEDLFWKPRLVVDSIVSAVKGIGKNRNPKRFYLPMNRYPEEFCYPRPQMARDSYFCLNGVWQLTLGGMKRKYPIRVPFPPQSARSGMKRKVGDHFTYHRSFRLPAGFNRGRVLLHFGAVDQIARVWLNGNLLGEHEGGYLPFFFDVTDCVKLSGENRLTVQVTDALDHRLPYGKQSRVPGGMWYPQISGIWQTVWMESVPEEHTDRVVCSWEEPFLKVHIEGTGVQYRMRISLPGGGIREEVLPAGDSRLRIEDPVLWTPETPTLYYFTLKTGEDSVRSYFALRTVSIEKVAGHERICLNHAPYFFHGVLDQGYYSDGIWTPPSYKWYARDICDMKELGFNTLRMHIKVENPRFYYDCDRLGMVVFQDMVNNGSYNYLRDTIFPTVAPFYMGHRKKDTNMRVSLPVKQTFIRHAKETVEYLRGFASVLYYTVFNEGWGQFDSDYVTSVLRQVDSSRIYDSTSGWYVQKDSDVHSLHYYFHKVKKLKWTKPVVISEFGGFVLPDPVNSAFREGIYGYGVYLTEKALTSRILKLYMEEILPLMKEGICGTIYTQLSDVEAELNGLYTYNRSVCKVSREALQKLARLLQLENERLKKMEKA